MKALALLLVAVSAQAAPVRVFYRPDGRVIVLRPVVCGKGEAPQACLDRVGAKDCPRDERGACLPYGDIDDQTLPPRPTRDKWRGSKARGLWVDNTFVTREEKIAAAEAALDAELAKEAPSVTEVVRRFRLLEKARAAPSDFAVK